MVPVKILNISNQVLVSFMQKDIDIRTQERHPTCRSIARLECSIHYYITVCLANKDRIVTYCYMETNFAVSLAPPTFDIHWGKCVERIANGNVGIKMVYLSPY